MAYHSPKTGLTRGVLQKKLASLCDSLCLSLSLSLSLSLCLSVSLSLSLSLLLWLCLSALSVCPLCRLSVCSCLFLSVRPPLSVGLFLRQCLLLSCVLCLASLSLKPPRGPREASWCREAKIAARQFLPLNCRAITLSRGGNFERGKNVLYCGGEAIWEVF